MRKKIQYFALSRFTTAVIMQDCMVLLLQYDIIMMSKSEQVMNYSEAILDGV